MSSIRLKHASGNSMSLAAPGTNPASNLELKLPHTIGSANQLLKVDGSGQLGWATDSTTDSTKLPLAGGTLTGELTIPTWLVHSGDSNTKFGFEGPDTITFETAGSERLRIQSTGQILYSAASGDNQITSKRTNAAGSNGNYFFHLAATNNSDNAVGGLGFHRDTATDDSRFVLFTRNTGGSNQERLRIDSSGIKIVKNGRLNILSTFIDFSGSISTPATAAAIYRPADNNLAFSTANTERLRILNGGDVSIADGDLIISTSGKGIRANGPNNSTYGELKIQVDVPDGSGNNNEATFKKASSGIVLAFPNGGGIDFSASEGGHSTGTHASILDDYETGNYNPGITFGNGSSGLSLGTAIGSYTKIGRRVFIDFVINFSNVGTSTGVARISALPFTSLNDTRTRIHGFLSYYASLSGLTGRPFVYNPGNATTAVFYDDGTGTQPTLNETNFANGSVIRGKLEYDCA